MRSRTSTPVDRDVLAYTVRGLKWFHRQALVSHGVFAARAPFTGAERAVLHLLLRELPEPAIADRLRLPASATRPAGRWVLRAPCASRAWSMSSSRAQACGTSRPPMSRHVLRPSRPRSRSSYQLFRSMPATTSKCSSRLRTGNRCSRARAAIQASLAGIGRPRRLSATLRPA